MYNIVLNDGITIKTIYPMDFFNIFKDSEKPFEIRIRREEYDEILYRADDKMRWRVDIYFRPVDRAYFLLELQNVLKSHVNQTSTK